MATNLGLEASIYDNSAKQNIAWFNCLANKHAVPVSASKNKSLGEKILKSFDESWENYANTKLRIVKISAWTRSVRNVIVYSETSSICYQGYGKFYDVIIENSSP